LRRRVYDYVKEDIIAFLYLSVRQQPFFPLMQLLAGFPAIRDYAMPDWRREVSSLQGRKSFQGQWQVSHAHASPFV
jgi:hypothetical protein